MMPHTKRVLLETPAGLTPIGFAPAGDDSEAVNHLLMEWMQTVYIGQERGADRILHAFDSWLISHGCKPTTWVLDYRETPEAYVLPFPENGIGDHAYPGMTTGEELPS